MANMQDGFNGFYNEFKEWTKEQILHRTYDICLENADKDREIERLNNIIDKIKEIPLKHINNANEELQIILRNNNDLEYKNQCSHDFEIIRNNIEIIYNDILELLEEVE